MSNLNSDGDNIRPEANVIGLVSRIAVNLFLNPVDCSLVVWLKISLALYNPSQDHGWLALCICKSMAELTVDVFSIRVRQACSPVAMSSEPLGLAVVADAISASLDVGVQIRAVVLLAIRCQQPGMRCPPTSAQRHH